MLELLVRVIPLGIGAALTPSLLGLQLLTTSGNPWRARSIAVAAGAAVAFGIACGALVFGFAQLPNRPEQANAVAGLVRLLAAAALAIVAVVLFRPHPRLQEEMDRSLTDHAAHAKTPVFFTLAFMLSIKDVSSFVLLVPATHEIAASGEPRVVEFGVLLVVYALALSPVLVPPAYRLIRGDRANASMGRLYRFVMDHQLRIGGSVAAVFALYLLLSGLGPEGLGLFGS